MILYYYSKVLLDTKPVDIIAKLKFSDKSKKKIKKNRQIVNSAIIAKRFIAKKNNG